MMNELMMTQPTRLRCEYFTNPLCIDARRPRLSWWVNDPRRGARQTAYQVVVDNFWDSGKVESDQSVHVVYSGPELKSRQRCEWRVRTWDMNGEPSPWSEIAFWEMGLLDRRDWRGKWIGSSIVGGPYSIPPAPYLRKGIAIEKPVASARLYATALGVYEFEINGRRVTDYVFAPGRTEYRKRVPYHAYDVTALLTPGANACGAVLGDGWYCGHLHSDPRQTYGDRPRLLAQLEVRFADGSTQTIITDETWASREGPIRSSDMLMGEDYDARMENTDASWQKVIVFDDPGIGIVAHRSPPVRPLEEIKPIAPPTVSKNKRRWLFDLGQNIVGRVRLKIRNAKPGQTIDLRYSEMLDKDGKPYTLALRTARATDHYTTKGGAEEIYEPHFTFHGFRYVEVRDIPGTPTVDDLTGIALYSDCAPTGEFECSDPMLNKLYSNILWSQRGNFIDFPTDCPQRDERLGWTGDAQVFIRTAAFNMDVAGFFTKWIQDIADAQGDDGRIPSVVPNVTSIYGEGGPAWADAGVICPWTIYLCYGDTRILEDAWPMMTRFMDFLSRTCPQFIRPADGAKWKGYGDWLNIDAPTPPELIGTAFWAYSASLMSKIARVLGKVPEVEKYDEVLDNARRAWIDRFVGADGSLAVKTQTAYVLGLHFDLLPERHRDRNFAALVADIESRGMHLSTGFVGTPYLNHVLTRFGRPDVAYALLMQKTFPSWLYPITQGATTMWERWDAWTHDKGFSDTGMNSFNHYAYGAVGDWIFSTVAGIDLDASQPGYKHIIIRPLPGGGLTHARAKLESVHGVIESAWRVQNSRLSLDVTIPPNTTASIYLPTTDAMKVTESGKPIECASSRANVVHIDLPAGQYHFETPC
jgi:alpha-L-rhamnosidase